MEVITTRAPKVAKLLSETTSNGETAFPWKLHIVLEQSERQGFKDTISWEGDRAFKVHDPKKFGDSVMKEYFNQTQYKSFQRQLNIYGFERITAGKATGSYTHDLLVRGKPDICRFMIRTKIKRKGSKSNKNKAKSTDAIGRRHSGENLLQGIRSQQYMSHYNVVVPRRSKSCPDDTSVPSNGNIIEPARRISCDALDASNNSVVICAQTVPLQGLHNQSFPNIVPCDNNNNSSSTRSMLLSVMNKRASNSNSNLAFNNSREGLSFHQQQQQQQQYQFILQQQQRHKHQPQLLQQQHQYQLQQHLQLQQMQGLQLQQLQHQQYGASGRYPQHVEQQSNIPSRHTYGGELDLDTIFEDNNGYANSIINNNNNNNNNVDSCLMTPLAVDAVIDCDYNMVEEAARMISAYQCIL